MLTSEQRADELFEAKAAYNKLLEILKSEKHSAKTLKAFQKKLNVWEAFPISNAEIRDVVCGVISGSLPVTVAIYRVNEQLTVLNRFSS